MPPGAERREEADSRERKVTIKRTAVRKNPQRQIRKNEIFTYLEVQGTLPCREIFKRQAAS